MDRLLPGVVWYALISRSGQTERPWLGAQTGRALALGIEGHQRPEAGDRFGLRGDGNTQAVLRAVFGFEPRSLVGRYGRATNPEYVTAVAVVA